MPIKKWNLVSLRQPATGPYRKTHLYLSTKLAFWETQLPGYVKRQKRPKPSSWTHLCGQIIFLFSSLEPDNLSSTIFVAK